MGTFLADDIVGNRVNEIMKIEATSFRDGLFMRHQCLPGVVSNKVLGKHIYKIALKRKISL